METKYVYVVTGEDYLSGHNVEVIKAFLDEQEAEDYCDELNDGRAFRFYRVEECELKE